jgi:autotransporter translocation and assembly factor TamB
MRRVLIIIAVSFAALVGAALLLFSTTPGRTLLARAVEARLASVVGGEVAIGSLSGAPPGKLVLDDVRFEEARGVWLTIDRAELDWRPLDLLRGRVVIDRALIRNALLEGRPPKREGAEKPFALPDRLPPVAIGRLEVDALTIGAAIAGRPVSLRGGGRLVMGGAALDADLSFAGSTTQEHAKIALTIDPTADRLHARIDVASPNGGALASLAGLGGALTLTASGEGPPGAFRLDADARLGAVGAIRAALSTDVNKSQSLVAAGAFDAGPRLAGLAQTLGPTIDFDIELRRTPQGLELDLRRLASRRATAQGTLGAEVRRDGTVARAAARAAIRLADSAPQEVKDLVGGDATIEASAELRGKAYAVSGVVSAPRGALRFADAARRGETLAALVDVDLKPSESGPAFARGGVSARGVLSRAPGGRYAFDNAQIGSPSLGAFVGRVDFVPSTERFSVKGEARIARAALDRHAAYLGKGAEASARVDLEGTLDDFAAKLDMSTKGAAPGRLAADLAGLPDAPRGLLVYERRSGIAARAELETLRPGLFRLREISARAKGFSLKGSAEYAAKSRSLRLDIDYASEASTDLGFGVSVSGKGRIAGPLALEGGDSAIEVSADSFSVETATINGLEASARGPASALRFNARARLATFGGAPPLRAMRLEGEADLHRRLLNVAAASARTNETALRLLRPAQIGISNGVWVKDVVLGVGNNGFVALDGAWSARRWSALIRAEDLALSETGAAKADFSFRLDTDHPEPGSGAFRIAASAADGAPFEIGGVARWDGKKIRLEDSGANERLDFSVDLPAALRRGAPLRLDRSGALRGEARFKGPVEAVADFLPPALQTLEGDLEGSAALAGTTSRPALTGALTLADGSYTELVSGLTIAGLSASARATPTENGSVIVIEAAARDAEGERQSVKFSGRATLGRESAVDGAFVFDDAAFTADLVERAIVAGSAQLTGPLRRPVLSGDLDLKSFDYRLKAPKLSRLQPIEIRSVGDDAPKLENETGPRPRLDFDLRFLAANNVILKGRGLDSVWKARLALAGTSEEPMLTGRLDLQRGAIDFSGRRFAMTRSAIVFDRFSRNNPELDMRAERRTRDGALAVITIKGRARAPEVSLSAIPSAPAEDVTALVLFGKRAVDLTAVESLQAAQALAQLSGFGGGATRALGLDMLNVDFDSESGAGAVAVGKTVAKGLFVSARQDVRGENGSVRVEYGVTDAFSVETELKQNGDQTISANWKKDF